MLEQALVKDGAMEAEVLDQVAKYVEAHPQQTVGPMPMAALHKHAACLLTYWAALGGYCCNWCLFGPAKVD